MFNKFLFQRFTIASICCLMLSGWSFKKPAQIEVEVQQSAAAFITVTDCKQNQMLAYCAVNNKTSREFELYNNGFQYRTVDRNGR